MTNDKYFPTPDPQVAATLVDGQAVVVMADSGQVTVLNETGARIWGLCDGMRSVAEINAMIIDEYDVSAAEAAADMHAFLDRLVEIGAIVLHKCS
jgi:hypothetical protein